MPCTQPSPRRAEAAVRRALSLCVAGALLILAAACSDRAAPAPTGPEGPSLAKSSCTLGVPDATALSTIADLVAAVNALEAAGSLTAGQANALRQHLESARQAILAQDYCTALTKLRTFREQAGNFVKDGTLTAEEGETLTGGATDVLEGVIASISAGMSHACALTTTGAGYCWGDNLYGELGDGTATRSRLTPVQVGGPPTPGLPTLSLQFTSISAGREHTCGVAALAYCWGDGLFGQLGDGTSTIQRLPVPAQPGLGQVASISAGSYYTCAVTTGGGAYCWGGNAQGQLGDGGYLDSFTPIQINASLGQFGSISAGFFHTCAVTTAAIAYCWGSNYDGQLGDGSAGSTAAFPPVQVGPGLGLQFASVTSGWHHTCGVTTAGKAYCWGNNIFGQVGDGTTSLTVTTLPVAVKF